MWFSVWNVKWLSGVVGGVMKVRHFFSFEKLGGFIERPCICSTRCHVPYTAACQIIVHVHVHVPISTAPLPSLR